MNMNQKLNRVRALFLACAAATTATALCVSALAWMSRPNTAQAREWQQPNVPEALPILGSLSPTTTRAGEAGFVLTLSNSTFTQSGLLADSTHNLGRDETVNWLRERIKMWVAVALTTESTHRRNSRSHQGFAASFNFTCSLNTHEVTRCRH